MTRQRTITSRRVAAVLLIIAALVAFDFLVLGHQHTKTATRVIRVYPIDPTTQAGQAGLIAADQKYMLAQDAISWKRSIPTWVLGYIVSSASPTKGQVLNWVLSIVQGQETWSSVTAKYTWDGHRWAAAGISFIQPLRNTPSDYDKFQPFAS